MYTIYYIFLGIIIISFITGIILNKIEKNTTRESIIANTLSMSEEMLNTVDEDDLSKTRVFTIPFSSNYIENDKIDKIKKNKQNMIIDDEIL